MFTQHVLGSLRGMSFVASPSNMNRFPHSQISKTMVQRGQSSGVNRIGSANGAHAVHGQAQSAAEAVDATVTRVRLQQFESLTNAEMLRLEQRLANLEKSVPLAERMTMAQKEFFKTNTRLSLALMTFLSIGIGSFAVMTASTGSRYAVAEQKSGNMAGTLLDTSHRA